MLEIIDKDGEKIRVRAEYEHHIPALSSVTMAHCYFKHTEAASWPGIVVLTTVAYADVFGHLDKISASFGGNPGKWESEAFTELEKGMNLASYIRTMEPDLLHTQSGGNPSGQSELCP